MYQTDGLFLYINIIKKLGSFSAFASVENSQEQPFLYGV